VSTPISSPSFHFCAFFSLIVRQLSNKFWVSYVTCKENKHLLARSCNQLACNLGHSFHLKISHRYGSDFAVVTIMHLAMGHAFATRDFGIKLRAIVPHMCMDVCKELARIYMVKSGHSRFLLHSSQFSNYELS
jgi:hypothetical protein